MESYFEGGGVTMYCGSCLSILPQLLTPFDACVTDPPYGLKFMGKEWDHGVPGAETWLEVLRLLKPGGHLMAFGGTRTYHRLACAIEDAGFEMRDTLMWLYGSGFPKSMDISKALDRAAGAEREVAGRRQDGRYKYGFSEQAKRAMGDIAHAESQGFVGELGVITVPATDAAKLWEGYGTALKPAWEPIILAMKPCEGTFAENALKHGVAGLSIDSSRIACEGGSPSAHRRETARRTGNAPGRPGEYGSTIKNRISKEAYTGVHESESLGRWPANLLLDEDTAGMLDEQAGASRFFYVAKTSQAERGSGNNHPTVKPVRLVEYLSRLLLPPKRDTPRRLLVPFSGSGSEILGALRAGWDRVVAIEKEEAYCATAACRLIDSL